MTTETRTDHPLLWAHANTPAAVDAVREVLMRAKLSEPTLSYVLTAPDSEVTYAEVFSFDCGIDSNELFLLFLARFDFGG